MATIGRHVLQDGRIFEVHDDAPLEDERNIIEEAQEWANRQTPQTDGVLTPNILRDAVERYTAPWNTPDAWTIQHEPRHRERYFAVVDDEHLKHPTVTTHIPRRADDGSAGYDFYSKETVSIAPGELHVFWTDVKVYMRRDDEVFKIYIRSSLAYNRDLSLANSVGIIDRSYFGNEKNDGNIGIGIRNMSSEVQHITVDERIAQGIFEDFYIVDNDEARIEEENGVGRVRTGGMGSTGETHLANLQVGDTLHGGMPVGEAVLAAQDAWQRVYNERLANIPDGRLAVTTDRIADNAITTARVAQLDARTERELLVEEMVINGRPFNTTMDDFEPERD